MSMIYGREELVNSLQDASGHEKKGIEGELQVLNCLEQVMPKDSVVIVKPDIGNLEPDFIIVLPKQAFFIVEVKNYSLGSISNILSNGLFKFNNRNDFNAFSQVGAHLEQLNRFIMSNYEVDVYRLIGKLVLFPNISKVEFQKKFITQLSSWSPEESSKFYRYHAFEEDMISGILGKLKSSRKYPKEQMKFQIDFMFKILDSIKPRSSSDPFMDILHRELILDSSIFDHVIDRLVEKDHKNGKLIKDSFKELFNKELPYLRNAKIREQAYLALSHLMVAVKAESSVYLNYINELSSIEKNMLYDKTRIIEQFKEDVQQGLHMFFEKQLKTMNLKLKNTTKWHTTLGDTSKKAAAFVYNPLMSMAKKNSTLKDKVENLEEIDDKSELEKLLEQYLSKDEVSKAYDDVMKNANNNYDESWKQAIGKHTPNLRGIRTFSTSSLNIEDQRLNHQLGASEQVLGLTVGSAVVGTIGLAAGWHTLTYAALNVFPPIALFAAFATIATAVISKDKEIKKKQTQLEEAVNSYKQHLFQEIDPPRIKGNNNSLFHNIEKISDDIVSKTIDEWEAQLFGQLEIEDYKQLVNELLKYAQLIDDSRIQIKNYIEQVRN